MTDSAEGEWLPSEALLRLAGVVDCLTEDMVYNFFYDDIDTRSEQIAAGLGVASALRRHYIQNRMHPDRCYTITEDHQSASKEIFDRFYQLWSAIIQEGGADPLDSNLLHRIQRHVGDYFRVITGAPWADRNDKLSWIILNYVLPSVKLEPEDPTTAVAILASSEVLVSLDCLVELYDTTPYLELPLVQQQLVLTSIAPAELRRWIHEKDDGSERYPKWKTFLFSIVDNAAQQLRFHEKCSRIRDDERRLQSRMVDVIVSVFPARNWATVFGIKTPIFRAIAELLQVPQKGKATHSPGVLHHHLALDVEILRYCFKLSRTFQHLPYEVVTHVAAWLYPYGVDLESIPLRGLRLV